MTEEKKETKVSPWPWKCARGKSYCNLGVVEHCYDIWQIKDANQKVIAKLEEINDHDDFEMDASLMSAAPELRSSLEMLVGMACRKCKAIVHDSGGWEDIPCERRNGTCPYGIPGAKKAIDKSYGKE